MSDPAWMRVLRAVSCAFNADAVRCSQFILRDRRAPCSLPLSGAEAVPGSYRSDRDRLDAAADAPHPAIIFQTWKSRADVPANYGHWRGTFLANNPDHVAVLWDDDDNRAFIADRYVWFLDVYDGYPKEIYRADIVRFFFLLEFGGFYADMDTECLRPVGAGAGDVRLCRMGRIDAFEHSIPNAVMASRRGQAFWLLAIRMAIEQAMAARDGAGFDGPEAMTGPVLLKRAHDAYVRMDAGAVGQAIAPLVRQLSPVQRDRLAYGRIDLLAPQTWYPLDWTNPLHKAIINRLRRERRVLPAATSRHLFRHSDVVTFWSHSWA